MVGCCARTAIGQTTAVPPRRVMNSRRLMPASANDKAWYRQKLAHWKGHQCPLYVKSGHFATSGRCPLYSQKRTLIERVRMSASCQTRKYSGHAPLTVQRKTD